MGTECSESWSIPTALQGDGKPGHQLGRANQDAHPAEHGVKHGTAGRSATGGKEKEN